MPNATVRANARGLSKARPSLSRSKTRRPVRAKKRTPVKKAAPDAAARLSFVASRDGITLPLATERQDPRCFWHVKPTGDYAADCVTGESSPPNFSNTRPSIGAADNFNTSSRTCHAVAAGAVVVS
jgi:hypothetical protein